MRLADAPDIGLRRVFLYGITFSDDILGPDANILFQSARDVHT